MLWWVLNVSTLIHFIPLVLSCRLRAPTVRRFSDADILGTVGRFEVLFESINTSQLRLKKELSRAFSHDSGLLKHH